MTGVRFPKEVLLIVHAAPGVTQPIIEHLPGDLAPGVKRPEHENVDLEIYSSYYSWKIERGDLHQALRACPRYEALDISIPERIR
jgi:hypothetical protein